MIKPGDKGPNWGSGPLHENYVVFSVNPDKVIGTFEKPEVGKVAIAIARQKSKNQKLTREFRVLSKIHEFRNGPRTVPLHSKIFTMLSPDPDSTSSSTYNSEYDSGYEADIEEGVPNCRAYTMSWIDNAFHSKTNKPGFDRLLARWATNRSCPQFHNVQADLQRLDLFCRTEHSIGDLQVMLEQNTGKLFLIDPTGLTDCEREGHRLVNRWIKILNGEIRNIPNDPGYKKAD